MAVITDNSSVEVEIGLPDSFSGNNDRDAEAASTSYEEDTTFSISSEGGWKSWIIWNSINPMNIFMMLFVVILLGLTGSLSAIAATAKSNVVDNMSSTTKASKVPYAKSAKSEAPSESPSEAPSASPSAKPSDKPSLSPSETPSASVKPSDMPSPAPSECAGNWEIIPPAGTGKYCNPACGCYRFTTDPSSATPGSTTPIGQSNAGYPINLESIVSPCVIEVVEQVDEGTPPNYFITLSGDGKSLILKNSIGGKICTFTYSIGA
jgi:hypothetical protein